jgi:phytoene dehydrogenase-like protein
VAGDRALVLWPELHAAQASLAALSQRDAEALPAFTARLARAAAPSPADQPAIAWLTSAASADGVPDDRALFRLAPLARILDEAFDNELLKGLWAQSAIMDTGASPRAPASAALLTRASLTALATPAGGHRLVAGGKAALRRTLLALLKFYNNADIRFATEAKEIAAERDAVQAVVLADGSQLRAPLVVSALSASRSRDMLKGLRRLPPPSLASGAVVEPAHVKLTIGALPKLGGVDAATLASGAVVRLNPSIARLVTAHGAFRARTLGEAPCVEFRILPAQGGAERWDLHAFMPYVPVTTADGPWTGKRRDGIRSLCVRMIDDAVPGFGATIEKAELLNPPESETVMDPKGAAALTAKAALDLTGVPERRPAEATTLVKGLTVLEPSLFSGIGDAGLAAAAGLAAKVSADG